MTKQIEKLQPTMQEKFRMKQSKFLVQLLRTHVIHVFGFYYEPFVFSCDRNAPKESPTTASSSTVEVTHE